MGDAARQHQQAPTRIELPPAVSHCMGANRPGPMPLRYRNLLPANAIVCLPAMYVPVRLSPRTVAVKVTPLGPPSVPENVFPVTVPASNLPFELFPSTISPTCLMSILSTPSPSTTISQDPVTPSPGAMVGKVSTVGVGFGVAVRSPDSPQLLHPVRRDRQLMSSTTPIIDANDLSISASLPFCDLQ